MKMINYDLIDILTDFIIDICLFLKTHIICYVINMQLYEDNLLCNCKLQHE